MTYADAIDFLYGLQTFGIKLGLRNITRVLGEIGNPHHRFRSIHIAGTNGKGSTAALVESVLRTAGYKTGLFTSPHLFDFSERIRINGLPMPRRRVAEGVAAIEPYIRHFRSTFFEASTALAFNHFAGEQVDIAVIEVGMGGRLDATNVLNPVCTIITDIDYDHTDYLGSTLERIAGEKAAVIKPGGTVITSVSEPDLLETIGTVCVKTGATLLSTGKECTVTAQEMSADGSLVDVVTPFGSHAGLRLPLLGRHQIRNLGAAVLALDWLGEVEFSIENSHIREGVAATIWPGRLQVLQREPLFIVDGAHNPGGMRVLGGALRELFTYHNLVLVLGVTANKKYSEMMEVIAPLASHIIATRSKMNTALQADILAREAALYSDSVETIPSAEKAVKRALQVAGPGDAVCATGSLFLVGEILEKRYRRVNALFGLN